MQAFLATLGHWFARYRASFAGASMGKALLLLAVPVVGLCVICSGLQSAGRAVGLLDPAPTATVEPLPTERPTDAPPTARTEPTPEPPTPEPPTPEPTAEAPTPEPATEVPPAAVEPTAAPEIRAGVDPASKDDCPADYPIKGNINSENERIYHAPGQQAYTRTDPERCFATGADAVAEGFRQAQN